MAILNYYAIKRPDGSIELMRFVDGRPIPRPFQREDVVLTGGDNIWGRLADKSKIQTEKSTYDTNIQKAKYITLAADGKPTLSNCNYTHDERAGKADLSKATIAQMFPNVQLNRFPENGVIRIQAKLSEAYDVKDGQNNIIGRRLFLYDGDNSLDGINKMDGSGPAIPRIHGTAENETIVVVKIDFDVEFTNELANYNAAQAKQKADADNTAAASLSTDSVVSSNTAAATHTKVDVKAALEKVQTALTTANSKIVNLVYKKANGANAAVNSGVAITHLMNATNAATISTSVPGVASAATPSSTAASSTAAAKK